MKRHLKRACAQQLKSTFGLDAYRPGQKAAANALLSGRDLLCILPTGAGKSLCWQLPAVVHPGLTVVVSPLIALMRDQVSHLAENGVPAETINSLMLPKEQEAAIQRLASGQSRIVFVAPERLRQRAFLRLCCTLRPWMIVVDEAHCVVQWGGEFRPAYGEIAAFVEKLPSRPVLCAMTATADSELQRALTDILRLHRPRRVTLPIVRENLVYDVRTTIDRTGEILHMLQDAPCKTVVFCRTRARTEQLCTILRQHGIAAEYYHAGMDRIRRDDVQARFQEGRFLVLTATTAFGMGVDIPDIRRVIHDSMPQSLIDYVQQSGRAGRDRRSAACVLLVEPNDLVNQGYALYCGRHRLRFHPIRKRRYLQKHWRPMRQLLETVFTAACIPAAISRAFGRRTARCGRCSACRSGPLLARTPELPSLSREATIGFFLRWQRDAIARRHGLTPAQVLPDRDVNAAAKRLYLPQSAGEYAGDLNRLLEHFARGSGGSAGHEDA